MSVTRHLCVLVGLAAVCAAPVVAKPAAPKCDGNRAIVRIVEIKSTSSLHAYRDAQNAHIAWYRKNGFKNNKIFYSQVMVEDVKTKAMKYSETEVIGFHLRPPSSSNPLIATKDQAGWDAFVKKYNDSSHIKAEYIVCLPQIR